MTEKELEEIDARVKAVGSLRKVSYYKVKRFSHQLLLKWGISVCQGYAGPCFKLAKRRRLCTQCVEEEMNWTRQCKSCYEENNKYYSDLINDMYR